jgi:UDP-N-acetylglucosamine acyltransferase
MAKISPLAVVDPKASLAEDVEVGPFCTIGPDVVIGPGTRLLSHVAIMGRVTLGRDNILYPNVVLGGPPQDKKYKGEPTRLEIGDGNILREAVTIHIGTPNGTGCTRIGSHNMFMVNVHLGHDVQLGDNCILANNVMIAGHVSVGDNVAMMGGVGVHHFVRIGEYSFVGGMSRIHHDVPPFCKIDGADEIRGLNQVGLKRAGFPEQDIEALEQAYRKLFFREKPFSVAMAEFDLNNGLNTHVRRMVEFLRERDMGRQGRYQESLRK